MSVLGQKPSLHIRDVIGRNEGDWPTETDENGNYSITCFTCQAKVSGPKRALTCYPCHIEGKKNWDALTPEQQAARANELMSAFNELKLNR